MAKIFVSHAHLDGALVGVFTDYLERTVGIPATDIFCSARAGQAGAPGARSVEEIRRNLCEARLVIGFVTPNLYRSRFPLYELGAAWGLSKPFIPVVAPPLTKEDVPDLMPGLQAMDLSLPEDVAMLARRLRECLDGERESFAPRRSQGASSSAGCASGRVHA